MKKRLEHHVEQELVHNAQRALFELLELHDGEIKQLQARISELEQEVQSQLNQTHQLNQTIYSTLKSRSFRLGYTLLHPVDSINGVFKRDV